METATPCDSLRCARAFRRAPANTCWTPHSARVKSSRQKKAGRPVESPARRAHHDQTPCLVGRPIELRTQARLEGERSIWLRRDSISVSRRHRPCVACSSSAPTRRIEDLVPAGRLDLMRVLTMHRGSAQAGSCCHERRPVHRHRSAPDHAKKPSANARPRMQPRMRHWARAPMRAPRVGTCIAAT